MDGLSSEVTLTEGDITTVEVVSKAVEKAFLKVAVLVQSESSRARAQRKVQIVPSFPGERPFPGINVMEREDCGFL